MNLNTIFPLPAWLSADEKKRYNKMKRPFIAHARDLGIKMDPFLLAQINDYLITEIMVSRAEMPLQEANALPSEKLFKLRDKVGKMCQELKVAFAEAAEKTCENTLDKSDKSDGSDGSDGEDKAIPEQLLRPVAPNVFPCVPDHLDAGEHHHYDDQLPEKRFG